MSVEFKSVTKFYGKQKALYDVSFRVSKGEILGLLGPNGSGKSTLMKIITSYISFDSGSVLVSDLNISNDSLKSRAKIGYLPEHNPLYTDMYVREYLEFIAGVQKLTFNKKERIDQLIELTGLEVEQGKKIGQLSKGYRQRVGLAQALMHDPEVLILDEPTTGLDPNQLKEIRSLIKSIAQDKTVILSTHIMQEVEALCDRVIILKEGNVVADNKINEITHELDESYSVHVEFDNSVNEKELLAIEGVKAVKMLDNSYLLESFSSDDIRPHVFQFAVKNKIQVLSMSKVERSLEEAFQELTKK